jgi:hypothetical protein
MTHRQCARCHTDTYPDEHLCPACLEPEDHDE